jgi:hypothetical protein
MNKRRLVTVVAIVGVAAMLTISLPTTQVRADHCHPEHTKKAATPPTPPKPARRPARTRVSNPARQRTARTRVPGTHSTPVRTGVSSLPNGTTGSQTLSLEEIYSRDLPMAIVSLGEVLKAIKSGDRKTELDELGKALDKLITVYNALGTQIKPQFANSLSCPMMGSPIDMNMVDESLTRDYGGRKVAFCCAGCPSAWDKLNDAQKQAKVPGVKF